MDAAWHASRAAPGQPHGGHGGSLMNHLRAHSELEHPVARRASQAGSPTGTPMASFQKTSRGGAGLAGFPPCGACLEEPAGCLHLPAPPVHVVPRMS